MPDEKDVIKFTLQSFVGPSLSDVELSSRQKEAIQRLIYLTPEKFEGLCEDIVNEIHRRSGMPFQNAGPMQEKLSKLSKDKFRNLVIDTLLVYNYRNPGTEPLQMNDFLSNLESLISDLKIQSDKENFINKIKGLNFINIMIEYNKYIRKHNCIDTEVVDGIDEIIENEIKSKTADLIDCLAYPKIFISVLDGKIEDTEYVYHRNNLLALLNSQNAESPQKTGTKKISSVSSISSSRRSTSTSSEKSSSSVSNLLKNIKVVDKEENSNLIKSEMLQILGFLVRKAVLPAANYEYFSREIKDILNALNEIKKDINGQTCVNLDHISKNLVLMIDRIIEKFITLGGTSGELLNNLRMHRVSIETLKDSTTKQDAFSLIVSLAKDVQALLKNK